MAVRLLGFGSALLFTLFSAGSASAQRVSADIRIGGRGPISGRVHIESRDRYRDRYYRDYGYRPRQVRVEVVPRYNRGQQYGWRRNARVVVVYYDRDDDCYYDRRFYPGLEEIRVFENDGRYYRMDDGYYDNRGYDNRGNDNRDYDGRQDDRYGRGYDPRSNGRDGRDNRDPRNNRDPRSNRDPRGNWDPRDGRDH
jgi:hypothetical protein